MLGVIETEWITPLIRNFRDLKFKPPLTISMTNWSNFRVVTVFYEKGHILINDTSQK